MKRNGPSEYLARLKEKFPKREVKPEYLGKEFKQLLSQAGYSYSDILASIENEDYGSRLLSKLKGRLPEVVFELFDAGYISIGEVGDPTPNAYTHEIEGQGYAIVFNVGLREFIYRVVRALATRLNATGDSDSEVSLSFEETCQIISDIFWWFINTEQASGPSYPIGKTQMLLASYLSTEAETFFVAHEIGHVLQELGKKHNLDILPPDLNEQNEEHYADRFAVSNLLARQDGHDLPYPPDLSYAGAILALQIFRGLESLGVTFLATHPSATSRLNVIKEFVKGGCRSEQHFAQLASIGSAFETIFDKVIETINKPEPSQQAFFDRASQQLMQELDDLLEQCTGDMFPDYLTFNSKAGEIFNRGFSHKLLERVALAARQFFESVENKQASQVKTAWKNFQKYKLFMSYIREMPEPVKTVFENELGIRT